MYVCMYVCMYVKTHQDFKFMYVNRMLPLLSTLFQRRELGAASYLPRRTTYLTLVGLVYIHTHTYIHRSVIILNIFMYDMKGIELAGNVAQQGQAIAEELSAAMKGSGSGRGSGSRIDFDVIAVIVVVVVEVVVWW